MWLYSRGLVAPLRAYPSLPWEGEEVPIPLPTGLKALPQMGDYLDQPCQVPDNPLSWAQFHKGKQEWVKAGTFKV